MTKVDDARGINSINLQNLKKIIKYQKKMSYIEDQLL